MMNQGDAVKLDTAQARDLAILVDLEARWENLRSTANAGAAPPDLQINQKAYEAFRTKLAAYNNLYTPAHVPELLLNTPTRLGIWCRRMRDLFMLVEDDPLCHCPVHVPQKAQRCAQRIGMRMNRAWVSKTQSDTMQAAIRDLETLRQWCEELAREAIGAGATASPPCPSDARP